MAKEKYYIGSYEECINTTFLHCKLCSRFVSFRVSFRVIASFSPTQPYLSIYFSSLHSRSTSNRYGNLLSAVAMGLNIPLGHCSVYLWQEDRPTTVAATSRVHLLFACNSYGRLWRTKHKRSVDNHDYTLLDSVFSLSRRSCQLCDPSRLRRRPFFNEGIPAGHINRYRQPACIVHVYYQDSERSIYNSIKQHLSAR